MNYLTLLLGSYLALAGRSQLPDNVNDTEWNQFKLTYGKNYESQHVETLRRIIYGANKRKIDEFNANRDHDVKFKLGVSHLSDLSESEMETRKGLRVPADHGHLVKSRAYTSFIRSILEDKSIDLPESVDWRKVEGRVTRVKDQGHCSSCWAFAATGALEGQERVRPGYLGSLANGSLVELSEQNLVDCVTVDYGCRGGLHAHGLDFVHQQGGIDDESSYPYEAKTGKCRFRKDRVAMTDAGSVYLDSGNEQQLKEVVAKVGPVALAISSSQYMHSYKSGILNDPICGKGIFDLNHGVLLVGYGTDPKDGDYWIVKNSWGPEWGEDGYVRMPRNKDNHCGIATLPVIPTF